MFIKKITLNNFNRFPLSDLTQFNHETESSLIMISGPNGAGKSSLINELSPLPSDKNAYNKQGYKEIHIQHNGLDYVLVNDFTTSTPKFSFKKEGEELNTAGIVTTQRDLAFQHFNISQGIHDILTGQETFCDMSLPARKKLFSAITHLNIDALLAGYNSLREELKTVNMLHKSHLANYKSEEAKLMDKETLEVKRKELEELKQLIDSLLTMRSGLQRYVVSESSEEVYDNLKRVSSVIDNFITNNYSSITAYPNKDLESIRSQRHSELQLITYKLDSYYKLLENKNRELSLIVQSSSVDKVELTQQLEQLSQTNLRRRQSITMIPDLSLVNDNTYSAVYKLESVLPEVVSAMLPNEGVEGERVYTTERYETLLQAKNAAVNNLHLLNAEEIAVRKDMDKVNEATGNIECPSCEHSWPLRDALGASLHKADELDRLQQQQHTVRSSMALLEKELDEMKDYFQLYKQLWSLRKDTVDYIPFFWETVDKGGYIFTEPNKLSNLLNKLNQELVTIGEIAESNRLIASIELKLNDIEATENVSVDSIRQEIEDLDSTIKELQDTKNDLTQELKNIDRLKQVYVKLEKLEQDRLTSQEKVREHHIDHLSRSVVTVIDDRIRDYRVSLLAIENELHQVNTIQYSLDKYQKDIDQTTEQIKVLEAMTKELCPKSGLIAKSVSSFLNTIIYNVNNTIAKIWNYKMVLRPIDVDSDSLNYKFRVEVEDKISIDDISKVSRGMKEAINLSFKLVIYKLLKLENYPLFLDELSSNMDKVHTERMTSLVHDLSTGGRFSQIYLITHKENFSFLRGLETIELG